MTSRSGAVAVWRCLGPALAVSARLPMRTRYQLQEGRIAAAEDGPIWVYTAPDEAELRELTELHQIERHNVDSALDPDEIGRVEIEPDQLDCIIKRPRNYSHADQFEFRVTSLGAFLFKNRLVLVKPDEQGVFEGKMFRNLRNLHDVLIRVVHAIISHYMGHLKVINMISDDLERKINTSMENRYLLNMFTLEKSLVYFLNALNDNQTLVSKLKVNAVKLGFTPDNQDLLEDIQIDNQQCLTLAHTYSNILSSLMDARASVVSNNLNVMMKNLNAIVIAVAIPSFFASMGGMSEFTSLIPVEPKWLSYVVFFLLMNAVGFFTFFIIRRWEQHWK
jgi:magnesium transporter